ncbi:MAG: ATP-binding protein [Chloroflexi bacterium]|nr:ATP-binding protein [Chloroflexota bacterium]
MKIHLVSPSGQDDLQTILSDYTLTTSHDPWDAVWVCQTQPDCLVIFDASFDEATTTGVCAQIRATTPTPNLFVIVPDGDRAVIDRVLDAGAIDLMCRPIVSELLKRRIQWILRSLETQQLHDALSESEQRIRTIIDNASMILIAFNSDGIITFASGSAFEAAGRKPEEILGRSIFELKNKPLTSDAAYVIESGMPHNSTIEESGRFYEVWYRPIMHDNGTLREVIGVAADVTLQVQAEQNLEKSLNFYLTFFEDFPVPVWRSGRNAHLNYINQSWMEFTGKTLEEALNTGWLDDVHPDDRTEWREQFLYNFRRRQPLEFEYRMKRGDGQYRDIINIGHPFFEIDGKFGGYIGLIYDITERKQTESAMIELELERQRVRMLQEFISTVSHDLKTPLSGIVIYADLLRKTSSAEGRARYSKIVSEQAHTLQTLLDNMLTMSRLDEEITTLTFQMTNIQNVVQSCAEFYRVPIEEKGLQLEVSIENDLPHVMANAHELRRSIGNLLDNAIKYSSSGKIFVRAFFVNRHVIVEVQDTGDGIAEEDLPRIFDRFYRADRARTEIGTGLGLTIVKKIVEAHGGNIQVESELNKGTTIRLKFPTIGSLIGSKSF